MLLYIPKNDNIPKAESYCYCVMSDSFATPWTVARQAPLSMGFPRQEYWNGLPFPFLGIFPGIFWTQGSNQSLLCFLHGKVDSVPLSHQENHHITLDLSQEAEKGLTGFSQTPFLRFKKVPSILGASQVAWQCMRTKRCGLDSWVGKIPWREAWQPTSVFLLGKSHGQRSLAGYSPWGCNESDKTKTT